METWKVFAILFSRFTGFASLLWNALVKKLEDENFMDSKVAMKSTRFGPSNITMHTIYHNSSIQKYVYFVD